MKTYAFAVVAAMQFIPATAAWANDLERLLELRKNPAEAPEEASWFVASPAEKKRPLAQQLGKIVLDAADGKTFVVAFGAEKSPFPWALLVRERRVELCEGNTFDYVLRNDKLVNNQWGVRWVVEHAYNTEYADQRVVFKKPPDRKSSRFDLWIPGTGWQYVGPNLSTSDAIIRTAELNAAPSRR